MTSWWAPGIWKLPEAGQTLCGCWPDACRAPRARGIVEAWSARARARGEAAPRGCDSWPGPWDFRHAKCRGRRLGGEALQPEPSPARLQRHCGRDGGRQMRLAPTVPALLSLILAKVSSMACRPLACVQTLLASVRSPLSRPCTAALGACGALRCGRQGSQCLASTVGRSLSSATSVMASRNVSSGTTLTDCRLACLSSC